MRRSSVTSALKAYSDAAAGRLSADGIDAETHVYYDDPVHAILDAATRQHADLIVMSTHGRGRSEPDALRQRRRPDPSTRHDPGPAGALDRRARLAG